MSEASWNSAAADNNNDNDNKSDGNASNEKFRNLLYLFLGLAIGMSIFGGLFYMQMDQLRLDLQLRHNETIQIFQERLQRITDERDACWDDHEKVTLEVAQWKGKMSLHTDLSQQYQDVLETLEDYKRQKDDLAHENRLREEEFYQQQDMIHRQRQEIEQLDMERSNVVEETKRLAEYHELVKEEIMQDMNRKTLEGQMQVDGLRTRIQRQEAFLCQTEYGKGPYYVEVTLELSDDSNTSLAPSFIVELASRRDMPHSVYTFLSLASYGMLDGMYLTITGNEDTEESHIRLLPSENNQEASSSFHSKRNIMGISESILSFPELSSQFLCEEYSIGFHRQNNDVDAGDDDDNNNYVASPTSIDIYTSIQSTEQSCFGSIVKGLENLIEIQKALHKGKNVFIQHAKILKLE